MKDWAFHLSLLVKKQIAPILSKTSNLNDKQFFSTLHRIDKEFDAAFDIAFKLIVDMGLETNQNRVPGVTEALLKKMKEVRYSRPPVQGATLTGMAILKLSDGKYSGIVVESNTDQDIIKLSYGPYMIDVKKSSANSSHPVVGSRVQFEAKSGQNKQLEF